MNKLSPAKDFLMNKMGLKWVGRAFKAIENVVTKMVSIITPKSKPTIAIGAGKGVRSSAEMVAIDKGIKKINKMIPNKSSDLEKGIIDINKQIKADYSNVDW